MVNPLPADNLKKCETKRTKSRGWSLSLTLHILFLATMNFWKLSRCLKSFMSWNGFPNNIQNPIKNELRKRHTSWIPFNAMLDDDRPKIWFRIPYLGRRSEHLKYSLRKFVLWKNPLFTGSYGFVIFIVIYNTKIKISLLLSNKGKHPDFSSSNVVYQVFCPGYGHRYVGKTDRFLHKCLSEHSTLLNTGSIAQHFQNCQILNIWST